ncbi:MAG: molybdopterin-dependent oxidoreductase, partial [Bacteroidota bacterium]
AFLVVVNSSEIKLTKYADLWIDAQKGSNTALMAGIINEVIDSNAYDAGFVNQHTENFTALKGMVSVFDKKSVVSHTGLDNDRYNQLIGLLNKPDANIVFIYNIDSVKEKSGGDLKAITNFLVLTNRIQKKNNGIYLMRDFVNSSGMMDMGMNPYYLPGHVRHDQKKDIAAIAKAWGVNLEEVFKPVEIKEKLLNNSIKAVLVFGEDPLMNEDNYRYFQGLEFLMVCDTHSTDTAKAAQMVFPLRNFTEQDGTVTSGDNNIQPLKAFISRENQPENWKIISELANNMGENFAYASNRSIFAEIQKINRFYEKTGENGIWSNDLFRDGFFLDGKKARFSTFTVDFSAKYAEKPVVHFSESFYRSRIKGKITQ